MPRRPLCLAHCRPAQITTSHSQPIKTVFTYQPHWGRHSVLKTDARREGKEWPSCSPQCCKSLWSHMICPLLCCHNSTESNASAFQQQDVNTLTTFVNRKRNEGCFFTAVIIDRFALEELLDILRNTQSHFLSNRWISRQYNSIICR